MRRSGSARTGRGFAAAVVFLAASAGWHVLGDTDDSGSLIYLHNGGTGGFRSIVAFFPGREAGVAILVNDAVPGPTLDALGLEILRSLATSSTEG